MAISNMIQKIRSDAKLSQEDFAGLFGVSRQSVQKWENGSSTPELSKLVEISKRFDISLDALVLERDKRMLEDLGYDRDLKPKYENITTWESYSSLLATELEQATDEGLDIDEYAEVFKAVSRLPKNEIKKKLGDVLFEVISKAKMKEDYPFTEPSGLEEIKKLRRAYPTSSKFDEKTLEKKIYGAWMGRICGCLLGKSVEGIKSGEFTPFLKETGNYPLRRYVYHSDLSDEILAKYNFNFSKRVYADQINGAPSDDDTNYTVLNQIVIEKYSRDFTPYDMSRAWLNYQTKDCYCTAERIAFLNFINGFEPPESAVYKNPYREYIGAQIRGDYFGYINPGDPELAAEMAWRDASISHVKNGIYGEMWVAAMLAVAAVTDDMEEIILGGLAQIPATSRLYAEISHIVENYKIGISANDCFNEVRRKYNECSGLWCHTISNAMIVAISLLYGGTDYAKSICMAVQNCYDTDCNGATVGSVVGMAKGIECIPEYWKEPIGDTLATSIFKYNSVKISRLVDTTLKHISEK